MRGINIWSRMVLVGVVGALCLAGGFSAWAGGNERIAILLDCGNTARENRQMGDRMERDLKNVLDKRGNYESRILRSRDEFKPGAGEYLLSVRIVRYNPGSKAARIIVGLGAGSCSLDIHYELFGPSGNMLLSKDDGCGSSLDWQRLARKLNETMLAAIQARLRAGNLDATAAPATMAPIAPVQAIAPVVAPVSAPVSAPVVAPAPAPVSAPAAVAGDSVEQLRQLDAMKKQRLISESEYKQKRKQILDRL
ncbi:MAG: DUF4410 domain-containing protein [bacterium]